MTVPTAGGWPAPTRLSAKVAGVVVGAFTSASRAAERRAAAVRVADVFGPPAAFGFAAGRFFVAIPRLPPLSGGASVWSGHAAAIRRTDSRDGNAAGRKA